jgi:hypothetical protein
MKVNTHQQKAELGSALFNDNIKLKITGECRRQFQIHDHLHNRFQ